MRQLRWWRLPAAVLVVGASLLAPPLARAQTGKIAGIATDAQSGAPVEGVQVAVQGTGYGAITGANGRYFIVAVPPGTYTVIARRIGYQSAEVRGVQVGIDITREVNFQLRSAAATLAAVEVREATTPLVERGVAGSSTTITAEQIQELPVTNIAGVLSLQQGFVDVPQNTALLSLAEETRSTVAPVRVRGARGGATVTLVDGIPVNNPLFGTTAVNLNSFAISGLEFTRGYMDPQYGNGLSGAINQATREGGTELAGTIDYQTSAIAGALGSTPDELSGTHLLRGYLSGPVPGTNAKLRYAVSGELNTGASRVLKFDDEVWSYSQPREFEGVNPLPLDLRPGWQAFGGRRDQQIVGKLTFLPTATSKINLLVIDQERQNLGYDRRYFLVAQGEPWALVDNIIDSLGLQGQRNFRNITQSSVRDQARIYGATFEQRFGRTFLQVRAGRTEFERNTCNIFVGVCVPQPFLKGNFTENFIAPFTVVGVPFVGSGFAFGGEEYTTHIVRLDLQSQVTDHHNIGGGASFTQHDMIYGELRGDSFNSGVFPAIPQLYRAKPIEAGIYLQDRIEYEFLTVRLGARYDYGKARGKGYSDPLNPTNGTTAREVCEGRAPSIGATTPYTFTVGASTPSAADDTTFTGVLACLRSPPNAAGKQFLLDSAIRVAQRDDFKDAEPRTAFSPRIGVSFPLTDRSAVFFNAGRYTKNPEYANLYRNSGVGTVAGPATRGGDDFCSEEQVKPGTNECYPPLQPGNPEFIGNPNLLLEQATQYEVGYAAEFGRAYAVNVAAYNRDESGLSGIVRSRPVQDIGTTYSGQGFPNYNTIVNQDFLTARGIEVQFRRRLQNRWGFDINYGWARATTNSPPPDRANEIETAGEINRSALREIRSEIDQAHRFNGTLTLAVGNDVPDIRFGELLRHASAAVTYSYNSGFPYTPSRGVTLGTVGNQNLLGDINSGRAPATQLVNLQLRKQWVARNVQYGLVVRVDNLLDRINCQQVFINTGTCEGGLREFTNRRVGNTGNFSSTTLDQPEYIAQRRRINTGLTITF